MTPEQLASIAGVVLSLVLAYVPGLAEKYDALANPYKVTLTGALLVLVAAGTLAWGCRASEAGIVACVAAGWEPALNTLIAALISNQSTYLLLVKPFSKPA